MFKMMEAIVPRQFYWFKNNKTCSFSHIIIFPGIHYEYLIHLYEYIQDTIVILRMLLVSFVYVQSHLFVIG